ncbi:cathepsin B [Topomyia yanbarensis]|uniref:cathepsin B n=1 Tax=Topomyia yanbarensis TaxID=2498891 RepID=UPI00273B5D07|nr:cathepsin B [Topomyia yanbarensis]
MILAVFIFLVLGQYALCQTSMGISSARSSNGSSNTIASRIQNLTKTWTPGRNLLPAAFYKGGVRLEHQEKLRLPLGILLLESTVDLPESFDAREKWPGCPSLREVRNQGCCGSCWAVSAASAMTDRWCIHSQNNSQYSFGSFDLMACCQECGDGCDGGNLGPAWQYWVERGISSGGPYNSRKGCHPYPIDVCHSQDEEDDTPKCSKKCQMNYNQTSAGRDLRYGREAYSVAINEKRIMDEIFLNGPVQAAFKVYRDFKAYKSGVYRHVWGPFESGHAIKMLGWGIENNVKYWLCANSWGEDWGDNGFFKIIRGENHLGIEEDIHAGLPDYNKHEEMWDPEY